MHEIEACFGNGIASEIVAPDFQIGRANRVQEMRLQVGGHDVAARAHALAEPLGDGAATSRDLETAPALTHSGFFQSSDRPRVPYRFEQSEPFTRGFPRIVQWIGVFGHRSRSPRKGWRGRP